MHSVCAEIGVFKGNFSTAILKVVKPQRLHLIDPWAYQEQYSDSWFGGDLGRSQAAMDRLHKRVLRRFRNEIAAGQVVVNRNFSSEAALQFPDAYFDWIYIDANHTYEGVKADLRAFYPKVKHDGFITGDNYGDRSDWWWKDGVKRAVDESVADGWCAFGSISNDQFILTKHPSRVSERQISVAS
jgi:Methyltransferase domain